MRKIGLLILFCTVVCSAWAVPARRGGIVKTQPDGTQITVYQHGDEHFRWITNEKGEWLEVDKNGFYQVTEALSAEEIRVKQMAAPSRIAQAQKAATPLNIAPRGLVILVNFADVKFETNKAELDSMLTGKNYSRDYSYMYGGRKYFVTSNGSAWQYFYESSNGQYSPQFDVVGPVTVSKNMDYYGKNNPTTSFDAAPWDMVKEACELVNDSVDFSLYDNDKDGYVDFVYVVYAGYGEADGGAANTIWPHSYWLFESGVTCKVDGKYVDLYACGNELDYYTKHHTGIGTFCHEFSHVLGLPDLYTTEGQTHKTLGSWDILDYGPYNNDMNTPPAYSAYERFMMGWLTPRLIVEAEDVELEELQESNSALLISSTDQHNLIGNDPNPTTFYLLENRQQVGWDEYLPGHGLMLTKISYNQRYWSDNSVNNLSNRMGVDLIEADGKTPSSSEDGYTGKASDLFPAGATEYLGIKDHSIEEVSENNGVISFKYKGGRINTATSEVVLNNDIIAIYDVLGQKMTTKKIEALSEGTYVVKTTQGTKKIIIR